MRQKVKKSVSILPEGDVKIISFISDFKENLLLTTDSKEALYKASYEAPLTRKIRLNIKSLICKHLLKTIHLIVYNEIRYIKL